MTISRAPVVRCGISTREICPELASTNRRRGRRMIRLHGCYLIGSSRTTSHGGPMRTTGMSFHLMMSHFTLAGSGVGLLKADNSLRGSYVSLGICRASRLILRKLQPS
jgi:hypothetical protein